MRGKTSEWPKRCVNIVKRNIRDSEHVVVLGQSTNSTFQTKKSIDNKIRLIISYNTQQKVFVAWNADIHRYIHSGNSICFNIKKPNKKGTYPANQHEIKIHYAERYEKSNLNYSTKGYEKIVLIGVDALEEFCKNYEEYIYPINADQTPDGTILFAAENVKLQVLNLSSKVDCMDEVLRIRDQITRARRDPTFRKRILGQANAHCLICGTKEQVILQAAHVQDVKYGGDDSTDNGICLCANHHLLYDSGLLDINWKKATFSCSSSVEQSMSWYKEAEFRGFKLIQ